jgi:Condensation domain
MTDFLDSLDALGLSAEKRKLLAYLLLEEEVEPIQTQLITPRDSTAAPPLSFAQQRLWVLEHLAPGTAAYTIPSVVRLTGALNLAAMQQSINAIVQRHEALRTTFELLAEQPVQIVAARLRVPLWVLDLTSMPATDRSPMALRLASTDAQIPFDLVRGPLLRTVLLRLAATEHVLLLTMHHIVADGWSMGVFLRDLAALYEALTRGLPAPLHALPIQYADFAVWQRQWLQGALLAEQLDYWKRHLADLPALALPTDHPRPLAPSGRGSTHALVVARKQLAALLALCAQTDATLFMLLLAAFGVLLRWFTEQEDIVIGADIANRTQVEVADLIGFFVNLLVMRVDLSGDPTVRELLMRVRTICLEAYSHQDLPFELLVDTLQPVREIGRAPLVQVVIVLQNAPLPAVALTDLTLEPLDIDTGVAKFDLILNITETPTGLRGGLKYNVDLFEPATIARLAAMFEALLPLMADQPEARLHDLTAQLTAAARQHQLAQVQQLKAARQQTFQARKRKLVGRVAQGEDQL